MTAARVCHHWALVYLAIGEAVLSHQIELEKNGTSGISSHSFISDASQESSGKQLLRRQSEGVKQEVHAVLVNPSGAVAGVKHNGAQGKPRLSVVAPHNLAADLHEKNNVGHMTSSESTWQVVSIGDAQALTIHDGVIYIVAHEEAEHMLDQGIYTQVLSRMTPYSNWTLIGLGSLHSIAVHDAADGKTMYGVGNNSWLYRQKLSSMHNGSVWELTSIMTLTAIAISGDTIYGVSLEHPSQVYKFSCNIFGQPSAEFLGWEPFTTGPIRSFSIVGNSIFAILQNNMIYNKSLAREGLASWSSQEAIEDLWTLRNNANMLSVAVLGDTIYGVSLEHKICRSPVVAHSSWAPIGAGTMTSLAINAEGDTIYGAGADGKVYSQDLLTMSPGTPWTEVGSSYVTSIAIQGSTIYGVGSDKRVYMQPLETLATNSSWEVASSCCVLQIAAADGILYAVHEDLNIYGQIDILMTTNSNWVLIVEGPIKSIAIRADTLYGITPGGSMLVQRLSSMATSTPWKYGKDLGDSNYPSFQYISILAHNDIMYACGLDQVVYSKLIHHPIEYPPGLSALGDTHDQALFWNYTFARAPKQLQQHVHNLTTTVPHTTLPTDVPTLSPGPTIATTTDAILQDSEPGIAPRYVDTYRDQNSNISYSGAIRRSHAKSSIVAVLVCLCVTGVGGA